MTKKVKRTTFEVSFINNVTNTPIVIRTFNYKGDFNQDLVKGEYINILCDAYISGIHSKYRMADVELLYNNSEKFTDEDNQYDENDIAIHITVNNRPLISKLISLNGYTKQSKRKVSLYHILEDLCKDLQKHLEESNEYNYTDSYLGYNLTKNQFIQKYKKELIKATQYRSK